MLRGGSDTLVGMIITGSKWACKILLETSSFACLSFSLVGIGGLDYLVVKITF